MKYIQTFLLAAIIVCIPLLEACVENEELPPITTEGKETFGCMVNGNLWLPDGDFGKSPTFAEYSWPGKDTVAISVYADNSAEAGSFGILVYDSPALIVGKPYDLRAPNCHARFSLAQNSKLCFYDSILSGNITLLKLDTKQHIVAGTFEFEAYSECQGTVTVTDGRFDITYTY